MYIYMYVVYIYIYMYRMYWCSSVKWHDVGRPSSLHGVVEVNNSAVCLFVACPYNGCEIESK